MIKIEVTDEKGQIFGPFPREFLLVVARLSGKKQWIGSKKVVFEASGSNLKLIRDSGHDIEWEDTTHELKKLHELEMMQTQHEKGGPLNTEYKPAVPYLPHMDHCLSLSWERKAYALLLEMGLCKTSICIANAGILFKKGLITGFIIWAPKGVHKQWVDEQIPEHIDPSIRLNITLWEPGETYNRDDLFIPGRLNIFALNIDSARTDGGLQAALKFIRYHEGHVLAACDESHEIKTYTSQRTKNMIKIGALCDYRRILTGTPIAKSLEDMWTQFLFLEPKIFGIEYLTVFKARFSELGGFQGNQTVGSKNIEEFYHIIAPHSYRLTKAEALGLPPKMFSTIVYDMDKETKKLYEDMKHAMMMEIDGRMIDANGALAQLIKMQQLLSGYVTIRDENDPKADPVYKMISTQRAEIVTDALSQINGRVIIWCSFIQDRQILADQIRKDLKREVAMYDNYLDWRDRGAYKEVILNPSASAGLNLQSPNPGDNNAIFYNNTRRSLHRWQAEDRIYRQGMGGTAQLWDIIARGGVCKGILQNLKDKKDLADLSLDDIRKIIGETGYLK